MSYVLTFRTPTYAEGEQLIFTFECVFISFHSSIFIELFDPIPCLLWYVGLILVFCLTSRFRLSSKFSAFPAFIIDNINISAKTLNWKWILFNLKGLSKSKRQKDTNIEVNKKLELDGENGCCTSPQIMLHIFLLCINKNAIREGGIIAIWLKRYGNIALWLYEVYEQKMG